MSHHSLSNEYLVNVIQHQYEALAAANVLINSTLLTGSSMLTTDSCSAIVYNLY